VEHKPRGSRTNRAISQVKVFGEARESFLLKKVLWPPEASPAGGQMQTILNLYCLVLRQKKAAETAAFLILCSVPT